MWCSSVVLPMWFTNHSLKRSFCPKSKRCTSPVFYSRNHWLSEDFTPFNSSAGLTSNLGRGKYASDLYGVTTTATTRCTVHGERFGMDSTQVVTKRKTLSLEVPCDDYSQMLLVRHETLENICGRQNVPARAAFEACPWPVKRWVVIWSLLSWTWMLTG